MNQAHIKNALRADKEVTILAFEPTEIIEYRGLPTSLPGGLEDVLIERLRPPWNITGNKKIKMIDGANELTPKLR